MPRPFTYISSKIYYDLQVYMYALAVFKDSDEYLKHSVKDRLKIDQEVIRMSTLLEAMNMFRQIPATEKAVVGMKVGDEDNYYIFPSPIVASRCLNINVSHIVAVCREHRPHAGGYKFEYEEYYKATVGKKQSFKWYDHN